MANTVRRRTSTPMSTDSFVVVRFMGGGWSAILPLNKQNEYAWKETRSQLNAMPLPLFVNCFIPVKCASQGLYSASCSTVRRECDWRKPIDLASASLFVQY